MKKEDLPNSQRGTGRTENKTDNRNQQKNQTTNVSNTQQNEFAYQAGLGRDRMIHIDNLEDLGGHRDYAENNNDDLSNEDLNASNDQ